MKKLISTTLAGVCCVFFLTCRGIPLDTELFDFSIEVISPVPKRILIGDSVQLVLKVHTNKPLDLPEVYFKLDYRSSRAGELYGQNKIGVLPQNNNRITNLDSFIIYYVPRELGEHGLILFVGTNFNSKVAETRVNFKADILLYDFQYENESNGYNPGSKASGDPKDGDPSGLAQTVGVDKSQVFSPYLGHENGNTGGFVNEKVEVFIYLRPSDKPYIIQFDTTVNGYTTIYNKDEEVVPQNKPLALTNNKGEEFKGGWVKFWVQLKQFLASKDGSGNGIYPLTVVIHRDGKTYPTTVDVRQTSEPIDLKMISIVDTTEQEIFTGRNKVEMHHLKKLKITLKNRTKSTKTKTFVAFKSDKLEVTAAPNGLNGSTNSVGTWYYELPASPSEDAEQTFDFYVKAKELGETELEIYAYNDKDIPIEKEERILTQSYTIVPYVPAQISRAEITPTAHLKEKERQSCGSVSGGSGSIVTYYVILDKLSFTIDAIRNSDTYNTKKVDIYVDGMLVSSNYDISQLSRLSLVNLNHTFSQQEVDARGCDGDRSQVDTKSLIDVRDKYNHSLVVVP